MVAVHLYSDSCTNKFTEGGHSFKNDGSANNGSFDSASRSDLNLLFSIDRGNANIYCLKPRLHWSGIMLSAARLSSFKRGFDLHWGGCKRKRRFDALGKAVCHVVLAYDGALFSGARLAITLRYVTDQQEKLILCISLSIQCQKHCHVIFEGSWQPETSILSLLPPSASVSMIILKTCATLWEALQPVPNKAMWEKFSTVSAVSALCGVCADGKDMTLQTPVSAGSSHF